MDILEVITSKHFIFPLIIVFLLTLIIVINILFYKKRNDNYE